MRRIIFAFAFLTCSALLVPCRANACGDKLINISQGIMLQRAAIESGSILVYLSEKEIDRQSDRLVLRLTRVGNKVKVVNSIDALKEALQDQDYDLVLMNLSDIQAVKAAVEPRSEAPQLIPLVHEDDGELNAQDRKEYEFTVSVSGKANDQVCTVSEALKAKTATDAKH